MSKCRECKHFIPYINILGINAEDGGWCTKHGNSWSVELSQKEENCTTAELKYQQMLYDAGKFWDDVDSGKIILPEKW